MMMMMDNNFDSDDEFLGSCYKEGVSCGSKGKGGRRRFVSWWRHFHPWLSGLYHQWRGDWPHNHHHVHDHDEHPFSWTHATQGDEEAHGILEGISSLHSWIKTQTMIRWVFVILFFFLYLLVFLFSFQITQYSTRPTKLGKKKDDMSFDDVSIQKLERLTFFLRTTTMTLW